MARIRRPRHHAPIPGGPDVHEFLHLAGSGRKKLTSGRERAKRYLLVSGRRAVNAIRANRGLTEPYRGAGADSRLRARSPGSRNDHRAGPRSTSPVEGPGTPAAPQRVPAELRDESTFNSMTECAIAYAEINDLLR